MNNQNPLQTGHCSPSHWRFSRPCRRSPAAGLRRARPGGGEFLVPGAQYCRAQRSAMDERALNLFSEVFERVRGQYVEK